MTGRRFPESEKINEVERRLPHEVIPSQVPKEEQYLFGFKPVVQVKPITQIKGLHKKGVKSISHNQSTTNQGAQMAGPDQHHNRSKTQLTSKQISPSVQNANYIDH